MLIGYACVSTQDQNLELQTEALAKAGCKNIFEDKISGSRTERHLAANHGSEHFLGLPPSRSWEAVSATFRWTAS
jgi:hypothetical protein